MKKRYFLLLILVVSLLLIIQKLVFGDSKKELVMDSTEKKVRLDLNGYIADIPVGYFFLDNLYAKEKNSSVKVFDERRKATSFIMSMEWPSMQPLQKEQRGYETTEISMVVSKETNENWPYSFFENLTYKKDIVVLNQSSEEAIGLIEIQDSYTNPELKRNVYISSTKPSSNLVLIRCNKGTEYREPICRRTNSVIIPGVSVSYRFSKRLLPLWQEVDKKVISKLISFQVDK